MVLNTKTLYEDADQTHEAFQSRLHEFLKFDKTSAAIYYNDSDLSYRTESVIPSKRDSRPPLLLLFGNPAPQSIVNKSFFAEQKNKRQHRFWPTLVKAGIISFKDNDNDGDVHAARTSALFDLDYESPFRIGLAVFHSIPSPGSGPWSGVAGLRKLFGATALRMIDYCEKERVDEIIRQFIGNSNGAVIAFQKDAYLGVKNKVSGETVVAEYRRWQAVATCCSSSNATLVRLPPTRYMAASWYEGFLRNSIRFLKDAGTRNLVR